MNRTITSMTAIAALALSAALAPSGADAASVSVHGGDLTVWGDASESNRLEVAIEPGAITVTKHAAVPLTGFRGAPLHANTSTCFKVHSHQLRCQPYGITHVGLVGGAKNDRLVAFNNAAVGTFHAPRKPVDIGMRGRAGDDVLEVDGFRRGGNHLSGEDGNDTLYGGRFRDALIGGAGNDRLYGGAEDDYLDGDGGRDLLSAGGGNDFVDAYDGRRDEMILCSPGFDTALIDAADQPLVTDASSCESVRRA